MSYFINKIQRKEEYTHGIEINVTPNLFIYFKVIKK